MSDPRPEMRKAPPRKRKARPRTRTARSHTVLAGAVLVFVGVLVLALRGLGDEPTPSPGDSVWQIIVISTVENELAPVSLRVAPPFDTAHVQLISQSIVLTGFRLRRVSGSGADRNLPFVADEPGLQRARMVFELRLSALQRRDANMGGRPLTTKARERYLSPENDIQSDAAEFENLAETLVESRPAAMPLADYLVQHIIDHVAIAAAALPDDALSALRTARSTTAGKARAAVALLRANRIPARLVGGVVLDERRSDQPHVWLEAFHDGRWQSYDASYGYLREVPARYVPMRRGNDSIAWADKGVRLQTLFSVEQQVIVRSTQPASIDEWRAFLDFSRLPETARATVGLLLLLPLAVLVTVFARQMVGVRTYGIFSPALLALAAQFVDLATAVVIVTAVAVFGIAGRALLPGTLTRTPRLAIVFTLVAVSMAIGVTVLLHLGRSAESVLVLLPVVVLANLVDRFYAVTDESGLKTALTRLAWTAVAALGAYFVLAREDLGQWLVHHPELHLVTIGVMIWMGGYRRKKLAEFTYFAWLREQRTAVTAGQSPLA